MIIMPKGCDVNPVEEALENASYALRFLIQKLRKMERDENCIREKKTFIIAEDDRLILEKCNLRINQMVLKLKEK